LVNALSFDVWRVCRVIPVRWKRCVLVGWRMWSLRARYLAHSRSGILKPAKVCDSAFLLDINKRSVLSLSWWWYFHVRVIVQHMNLWCSVSYFCCFTPHYYIHFILCQMQQMRNIGNEKKLTKCNLNTHCHNIHYIKRDINSSVYFLANVNSSSCSLYVIGHLSVCRLSVCRLSVTFVRPTQAIEIFGNISTPFGTLAICWHPGKILRRSSQGNPSVWGVKHNRGSRI